ncbi:hypothetical protein [Sporomusa acidovorans]|uniref:Flagellin N-methylase n=1 Tax=Sporomusa acidovorans (strain ATCC 49682 / DSM 3132 / Mol) TaxID=1123286 RepID=A0ABZ3J5E8_SPOA4|nr:hypothetical protein [Sporomusa acidovorans]OZC15383.1 hypothetical protein SPACI_49330 [Sporomusa acidovorans DSM 3132]SDF13723.1 hypothetical protein SAMN04488499_103440 [Sporomusa acidovorans]
MQDFFDAIDEFLIENPLPCGTCKQHCCKGRFKIHMDSISAQRLSKGKPERIMPKLFVDTGENKLEIFLIAGHKKCRYLDGLSRCLSYNARTASCRTYICIPQSACYKILDAAVAAEMHHAMRAEYLDWVINNPATPPAAIEPAKALRQEIINTSTAYGRGSYSEILIKDCVRADFTHSNVSPEQVRLFQDIVNQEENQVKLSAGA